MKKANPKGRTSPPQKEMETKKVSQKTQRHYKEGPYVLCMTKEVPKNERGADGP